MDQKKALLDRQETLLKEKLALTLIAEHTKEVFLITDRNGFIEWVNPAFYALTGYTFEEAVGKKPGALLQGPETDPKAVQAMREAIADRRPVDLEILNYSKQGQSYWLEISIYPVNNEAGELSKFVAVERDITQNKKIDAELRMHRDNLQEIVKTKVEEAERQARLYKEQKVLLDSLLYNMPLAVFAKDIKNGLKWILINKMAEDMFNLKQEDVIGRVDHDLFKKEEADFYRATDEKVIAGGKLVEVEVEPLTTPTGILKFHTLKLPLLDEQGNASILLGISEDVTDRIRTQEELSLAKETAERANFTKSEFLANMSHELRTPLNSIIGLTNMLYEDKRLDDEARDMAGIAYKSGENLLNIVNDILDLSKIEAGKVILENITFSLHEVFDNVVETMRPLSSEKGLTLRCSISPNPAPYLVGDPVRLGRILMNLISNAVKYTETGSVIVVVQCSPEGDGKQIAVECKVTDTGIGIPTDKQALIFDKFAQADSSITRRFGGTGLGLAITRELVEIMGGVIGLDSEPGKGSCFRIRIPFASSSSRGMTKTDVHMAPVARLPPNERKRIGEIDILVAEDHILNVAFIKRLLSRMGVVRYDIVEDGRAVLENLERKSYDLILMDCHMPVKSGYEATEEIRLREKSAGGHTPIIAMTADAMTGTRERCLKAGMDDYVSKPINPSELQRIMSRWITFTDETSDRGQDAQGSLSRELFDLAELKKFANDVSDLHELINMFLSQAEESLVLLRDNRAAGSSKIWAEAAHKIKGGAAMIGADKLRSLCETAQAMKTAKASDREQMFGEIKAAYEETRRGLEEYVGSESSGKL